MNRRFYVVQAGAVFRVIKVAGETERRRGYPSFRRTVCMLERTVPWLG